MSGPAPPPGLTRWRVGLALALFTAATLLFTFAFDEFLYRHKSSDLTVHLAVAKNLHAFADLTAPHFLFYLLVKAGALAGLTYETAAVWVLGLCYGGMAVLMVYELVQRGIVIGPFRAFACVMAVLLASHIFLFTIRSNIYLGYFVPLSYHNPTQQPNKLFALWIYFLYRKEFLRGEPARAWSVPLLAVLCVLSAIAKPSFLLAFLPAAALYALHDLIRRRWRQALLCLAAIGIPSALTMLGQVALTQHAGQPMQFAFRPFAIFDVVETLYKLPLSLAFPLIVAGGALASRATDAPLRFNWTLTAVALFITLCVVESGARMTHGNFAWTGQTGVFLAYVEAALFLLAQPRRAWTRAAWIVFAVHVACGVYWYTRVFERDWSNIV